MAKCYVKAYYDWIEQTALLSDAEKGRLFISILEYARSGAIPDNSGRESILFPVFKAMVDRDAGKSATLAENGSKGGRGNTAEKANESKIKQNKANESKQKPTNNIRHKTQDKEHKTQDIKHKKQDDFVLFWSAYPRKVAKANAEKAFDKVDVDIDVLLSALEQQKHSSQWTRDNGQYIPHPATWLNQRRWEDESDAGKNVHQPGADRAAAQYAGYEFDIQYDN